MKQSRTYDKSELYTEILAIAKSMGGTVVTKLYESAKTKMQMVCASGHSFEINQSNLKSGRWCPTCGRVKRATSRIALKGDGYLKLICKGRTIVCLDTKFQGVKKKHRFKCKKCDHEWLSTPDNIGQGKGCPPCSAPERIAEPLQKGKRVTYTEGVFFKNSPSVRTNSLTQVQMTGRVQKHYEKLGYQAAMNTLMWVKSNHLHPTSSYKLSFECLLCGEVTKRSLNGALKTKGCRFCYANLIGVSLRLSVEAVGKRYDIKIVEYKNSELPMTYLKKCGCKMSQSLNVIRLTGVGYCVHDSEFTWRTFENFIRDEVNGEKATKRKHGVTVDIITDKLLIETKLNIGAVFSNYGRRSPLLAIELYKKWGEDHNREFYVVVNEPDSQLREKGLPSYYIGWESWSKIGLTPKAVKFGKKIASRPQDYRTRQLSKEDKHIIHKFKELMKELGRRPSLNELKDADITIARLAMATLGTNGGSIKKIVETLGLGAD